MAGHTCNKTVLQTLSDKLETFDRSRRASVSSGAPCPEGRLGLRKYRTVIHSMMKGQKKTELIIYAALWTLLFAAPVVAALVTVYYPTASDFSENVATGVAATTRSFDWEGVWSAWGLLAVFLTAFAVHNFLIAPLLVYRNRRWTYCIAASCLAVCFVCYQLWVRPHPPIPRGDKGDRPEMERMERPPEPKDDARSLFGNPPDMDGHAHSEHVGTHPRKPDMPTDRKKQGREPHGAFGGEDTVAFVIMALLAGLNIGIKYFFKSLDDRKRMKLLERENLNRQLEYLKYQINPHFFMNTLNNIHALVDIDPEQAKHTIEVLSRLMRYALYEGNRTMAPLQKELDFISHYIDLMRIRYTDRVSISVSFPDVVPDVQVPSLLFTTFVENAFKHGVSYRQKSFIEVCVTVDEAAQEMTFLCANSRKPEPEDNHGGVGMSNARKRLRLIYGNEYEMSVNSNDEEYRLLLRLPLRRPVGRRAKTTVS